MSTSLPPPRAAARQSEPEQSVETREQRLERLRAEQESYRLFVLFQTGLHSLR